MWPSERTQEETLITLIILAIGVLSPLAILIAFGPGETPLTTTPQRIADIDAELINLTAEDIARLQREMCNLQGV
jgi:hypothetical protein